MKLAHCNTLVQLWKDKAHEWRIKTFGSPQEYDANMNLSRFYQECAADLEEAIDLDTQAERQEGEEWKNS